MLYQAAAATRAVLGILHPRAGRARIAVYDCSFERHCLIPETTVIPSDATVSVPAAADAGSLARLHALANITTGLRPRRVFEFGTFQGSSALVFAHNSDAEVYTLDLPPGETVQANRFDEPLIASRDQDGRLHERVRRLFGDSRHFDFEPYMGQMDIVYVDGGHDRDVVALDTENALRLITAQGTIIWDDYGWMYPAVVTVLDELFGDHASMRRIAGTRLVVLAMNR